MKKILFFVYLIACAHFVFALDGSMTQFKSGDDQVAGYLAVPAGKGPFPAVVVIHEWYGLNDQIKGMADRFAKEGYVALAVDLYRGHVAANPDEAHQFMSGLPEDRAIKDLKSADAFLQSRPDVRKTKIGSVGFCMGGKYSALLGMNQSDLAACAIFYGSVPTDPENLKKFNAPVIGFFGEKDMAITPEMANSFQDSMKKLGKTISITIYPGAGHAFMNETGKNYNPDAAKDAWAKVMEFFSKNLKS